MTRLIFFQRLEPVTTWSPTPPRTLNHTHTQTLCPDLHVRLLVHTGSNDTGASHRSILSCHSAGKHTHKSSRTDADTHIHTREVGYAFAHLCMLEAMFSTTSADALLLPLHPPSRTPCTHWTKATFPLLSRFLTLLLPHTESPES